MPVHITYHEAATYLPVLGPQTGFEELAVSGTAADGTVKEGGALAYISATVDCFLKNGESAVAVAGECEHWPAGYNDVRYVKPGGRISVIAAA